MINIYFDPILKIDTNQLDITRLGYRCVKSEAKSIVIVGNYECLKNQKVDCHYIVGVSLDDQIQLISDGFSNEKVEFFVMEPDLHLLELSLKITNEKINHILNKEIFALPLKVKSDEMMIDELDSLCRKMRFENVEWNLFVKNETLDELKRETDNIPSSIFSLILKEEVNKPIIGKKIETIIDNKWYVAFPIYTIGTRVSWVIGRFDSSKSSFLFSPNFFTYIENTLIYRKSLDKQLGFQLLADIDDVTGLFNQRKLFKDLNRLVDSYENSSKNFAIMFICVDHFKKVNDSYGHLVGSQILIDIGQELKNQLRDTDLIYRYGGDEFVVVMPNINRSIVHNVAVRVLNRIKEKDFYIKENENYNLTISIGLAEYPIDALTVKDIIKFADEMMYISKNTGRGKIFHISEVK